MKIWASSVNWKLVCQTTSLYRGKVPAIRVFSPHHPLHPRRVRRLLHQLLVMATISLRSDGRTSPYLRQRSSALSHTTQPWGLPETHKFLLRHFPRVAPGQFMNRPEMREYPPRRTLDRSQRRSSKQISTRNLRVRLSSPTIGATANHLRLQCNF